MKLFINLIDWTRRNKRYIRFISIVVVVFMLIISVCSCASEKRCFVKFPAETIEIHTVKDTTIIKEIPTYLEPDSAMYEMYIECDSNYNAVIRQLDQSTGKTIITEFKYRTVYKKDSTSNMGLKLSLNTYIDSIKVKNTEITRLRSQLDSLETVAKIETIKKVRTPFWVYLLILGIGAVLGIYIKSRIWKFICK